MAIVGVAFDHSVVLTDGDLSSQAEVGNLQAIQLHFVPFGDGLRTGNLGNFAKNAGALLPEAGHPYGSNLQRPRNLFTTKVASTSPPTSSAMMSSGLPTFLTCASSGSKSFLEPIFPS